MRPFRVEVEVEVAAEDRTRMTLGADLVRQPTQIWTVPIHPQQSSKTPIMRFPAPQMLPCRQALPRTALPKHMTQGKVSSSSSSTEA
jgi:hypothetical protein